MKKRSTHRAARAARKTLVPAMALALGLSAPCAWSQSADGGVLLEVSRFEVEGDNPLSAAETEEILRAHLGAHRDLATLEAAAGALETRIRDRGHAFHRVIVPAQKPQAGVVKLQVLQFVLDKVEVRGNQHFSEENIRRSVPALQPGSSPNVREVSRQVGLANEHPAKRLSIVMKEGAKPDALDAEIRVRDVPPYQFFVGLTGHTKDEYDQINRNTGYTRLTAGFQRSDLFGLDHAFTAAYSTSPEAIEDVSQVGLFYWMPLYGYHTSLSFYYTRSEVSSGSIPAGGGASFDVTGSGEFFGARATYTLAKIGDLSHSLSLAIDDRHFENALTVVGAPAQPSPDAHSRPLSVRYTGRLDKTWGSVGAYGEYAYNLHGGSGNDCPNYQQVRPNAPCRWDALRYGIDANYALPRGWGLGFRLRGQYAHSPLIPGEQFGIGGTGSIRGLRDREFTGDHGYFFSLEATGPALIDTLQPVLFYDGGRAVLVGPTAVGVAGPTVGSDNAASLGAGLRWNWKRRLDVSADLAYVINGIQTIGTTPGTDNGHTKLHFSVFYRF